MTANDVNDLRTAFHVNRLKETEVVVRGKNCPKPDEAVASTIGGTDRQVVNMLCKLHPSRSLDIFCGTCTCQCLICRDCVAVDRTHENHEYDLVEKVAPGYKKALLESLNPVQETQGKVAGAISQVEEAIEQVSSHGDDLEHQITHSFDEIAILLQQQKEVLVRRIRELEKVDIQELNGQEKHLCIASDELASLVTSAQAASKLSDKEFFTQRQELVSKIVGMTTKFKTDLSLTPTITFPHVGVRIVNPAHKVDEICKEFSIVCNPVDPTKCYTEGIQNVSFIDEPSSFKVFLLDSNGNPCAIQQNVKVELKSLRSGSVLPAQVTAVSSSCYYVTFIPQLHTRGRYRLDVTVNTVPIANSPFTIHIKCHPKQLGCLSKTIPCSLHCFGLSLSPEGKLIIVFRHHPNITHSTAGLTWRDVLPFGALVEFDPWLEVDIVGFNVNSGLRYPFGVVADSSGSVYVSDQGRGQVFKFSKDCKVVEKSSSPFKRSRNAAMSLNGIKISNDGNRNIFVCHSNKHCIEVFNSELTQTRHLGEKGCEPGQFNTPHDLSLDSQGNIYVTDSKNFRVQVLSQEGEFIRMFGTKGDKPGEFQCPNWIHVDGEFVYVTDYCSRYVSVFNVLGEFIHRFGAEILGHPEGIVVDKDGFVYIADSGKNAVFIF